MPVLRPSGWCVYLLRCGDGSLYCGITNDLAARLAAHRSGRGARYTRGRGPLRLVWCEAAAGKGPALKREHAVKRLSVEAKRALVREAGRGPARGAMDRSVIVATQRIRAFATAADFEAWLSQHHLSEPELWLKLHKKGSGLESVSYAEALDVCLCWGWIDGLRKSFDERSFLQRYTPRKSTSRWSQINQQHIKRLVAAGRMTAHGLAQVEAAKADGRWAAAYAPIRETKVTTVPADLRRAIAASPAALKCFRSLDKMNLFALAFRTNAIKTPEGRARKIAALVELLAAGRTIVPMRVQGPKGKK